MSDEVFRESVWQGIAPDVAGATGNWTDFLGAALTSAVNNTGGWLRMRVGPYTGLQSIIGWFSQYLGTFGGGDYLIGEGRTAAKYVPDPIGAPSTTRDLLITTTDGNAVTKTNTTTIY